MNELAGLALHERAALIGVSSAEYVALAESDRRIVSDASLATPASVTRLRRWLDSGRPEGNPERVPFTGSGEVRSIVVATLSSLPAPVRWHAVTYVTWFEVGRSAVAWQLPSSPLRLSAGDAPHVIALSGVVSDEALPGVIGHELSHSWHCFVAPRATRVPVSAMEMNARLSIVARDRGLDLEAYARELVAEELLADRTAVAWGLQRYTNAQWLLQNFRSELEAAAGLSAEIEAALPRLVDESGAYIADRATATRTEGETQP